MHTVPPEEVNVAERALNMWPYVVQFVASFKDAKKAPNTASFTTIKAACNDPFITAKLELFVSVAKQLQAFLITFQTCSNGPILRPSPEESHGKSDKERGCGPS